MQLSDAGPPSAPDLAVFKEHLRLAHGYADDGSEDGLIGGYLEAAVAAVERRIGRALVRRAFVLTLSRLARGCAVLPVGPVAALTSAALVDVGGAETALDPTGWVLSADGTGQTVRGLPEPAGSDRLVLRFEAGLSVDWAGVPADLVQAVMLLAADFYAHRGGERPRGQALPGPVLALTAPWRPARL